MNRQRGVSLSGFLLWCVVIGLGATVFLRIVPSAIDHYKLGKDAKAVVGQVSRDATVADVRAAYDKFTEIDNLPLKSSEIEISKENGQIVIRPMNYLAMSYDHRIIDGREAVLGLVAMKDALEDPARLLLDL